MPTPLWAAQVRTSPDGTHKYSLPRTDLTVTVTGYRLGGLALGSWVAFKPVANAIHGNGDLVLTEDEVAPVMEVLQSGGIKITALHNHLIGELPHVMYCTSMA